MRLKLENKEHNLAAAFLPLGSPSAPEGALNIFRCSVLSAVKVWAMTKHQHHPLESEGVIPEPHPRPAEWEFRRVRLGKLHF